MLQSNNTQQPCLELDEPCATVKFKLPAKARFIITMHIHSVCLAEHCFL